MTKKPRTTWNVPVSELFNEMLEKPSKATHWSLNFPWISLTVFPRKGEFRGVGAEGFTLETSDLIVYRFVFLGLLIKGPIERTFEIDNAGSGLFNQRFYFAWCPQLKRITAFSNGSIPFLFSSRTFSATKSLKTPTYTPTS